MRVALLARSVFPLHGFGGLERHVYDLARALVDRGVAVTLISPPPTVEDAGVSTPAAIHPAITASAARAHRRTARRSGRYAAIFSRARDGSVAPNSSSPCGFITSGAEAPG